ncbi:DNA polymerase I [Desulfotomaculum copahuensis]|uniref:DNA polymerase I n=1 Tax=Desulfotomaculum copahuensis TaxID=1838280 RepID=A0A1B7LAM5_9FIRM|nr:DNA polymerase I [Desulfotomaculum copahuensis]OAT79402.1 DNA polymerase I [Desulfotomaculum copahuensis]
MLILRLLVIDGNSLAHRAFHAIPLLSTSQGLVTNAVFGFTNMLFKVLDLLQPELAAVCFDKSRLTFRHAEYRDYKANRAATPDELRPQFPLIKEVLQAMRITILEYDGYEADDLIGALVTRAGEARLESIIVTGDQDALQLVSPLTKVLLTRKGITELEEYDEGRVWERFGVTPAQFADYKGLVGDKSDNIPGVPGIGPKTAAGMLKEFGSVEQLIARMDDLPARQQEKIRAYADQALLSKKLATIRRAAPFNLNLEECRRCEPDNIRLLALFSRLEFKSLIRVLRERMPEAGGNGQNNQATDQPGTELETYRVTWRYVRNADELSALVEICRRAGRAALALSGDRREGIAAAALAVKTAASAGSTEPVEPDIQVFFLPPGEHTLPVAALQALAAICRDETVAKLFHGAKNAFWLLTRHDLTLNNTAFDTMVAAYLLNPASPNLDLPDLALEHLNLVLPARGEAALAARADVILRLVDLLSEKIRQAGMERLYFEVELPLVGILAGMEMNGVAVDRERLSAMSRELADRIDGLAAEIHQLAGEEFNINSTRQLGHILFEKLQLPVVRKTKTGYSTDAAVLEELAPAHPVVARILEYRQLVKLKSTYVDGMAALIDAQTGRLHTTFHQTVTATGRLSSAEPNLQNIPIRMEEGRRIRQVFIPRRPGNLILSADYSQIELRVLAHMAGDVNLLEAFRQGQDIHTRTAAEVFGVTMAEVTADLRGRAKAVNFGIVYGISDFGLARDINVSRQEARQYIDNYFARYSGVKAYIDRTVQEAREKGYVTTILNRRRYLPDLFSHNRTVRSFGERTAMNTPIQGSAADIIKLAMVRIDREIKKSGLKAKMILQVHDELIFDVPEEEVEEMKALVKDGMENAIKLDVPLVVDMKLGPNWYEVKKI